MKRFALAALAALSLAIPQVNAADDIVDTAVKAGSFKTLVAAVQAAGLVDTLKGNGPFTVFAPTDEAFAKLPEGTVENLVKPENKDQLVAILTYHVVAGRVTARDAFGVKSAPTVNGQAISVEASLGGLKIDNANVVTTDIQCSNGVIHVIDSVILPSTANIPETATSAGTFNTLLAAAKAAGLVDALSSKGPLTVFAPTDEAFAALPKGTVENLLKSENKDQLAAILKYHVVSGRVFAADAIKAGKATTLQGQSVSVSYGADGVKVNDSKVVSPDIETTNGVIHVIDAVLLPKKQVVSQLTPHDARRMIEHAIADGSQRYNSHDHAGCAAVYTSTMRTIMAARPGTICNSEAMTLTAAMNASLNTHDMTQRAWKLRHALETTYAALAH
jgi:transforming growth factor-beta-induced protein